MAIDTAEKRKSISWIVTVSPGVTPNASADVEWRQEAGYSYPVTLDVPVPPAFTANMAFGLVKMDDVGRHLLATDVGRYITYSQATRKNVIKGG